MQGPFQVVHGGRIEPRAFERVMELVLQCDGGFISRVLYKSKYLIQKQSTFSQNYIDSLVQVLIRVSQQYRVQFYSFLGRNHPGQADF